MAGVLACTRDEFVHVLLHARPLVIILSFVSGLARLFSLVVVIGFGYLLSIVVFCLILVLVLVLVLSLSSLFLFLNGIKCVLQVAAVTIREFALRFL